MPENPLIDDRDASFLLYDVLDAPALCRLSHFAEHSRETFDMYLKATRELARERIFATYKPMDEKPAYFEAGRVHSHPIMRELWPQIVELGLINAHRPAAVGGQQVPLTVHNLAASYMMAANLSAFGYAMLTTGAAHLIEAFGSERLVRDYMRPMYEGRWTGTMALTEPQAGSNLAEVQTRATPTEAGHYLIAGSKVFISGGDQTLTDNIVHLVLARIDGAPAGIRGLSLFVVPKLRVQGDELVPNDVAAAGAFHKLGWRGLPSIALNFGEEASCHGYLVGEPHRGIQYMFQMMNEARINIGLHGVATASVAYHAALDYARNRPQGRAPGAAPSDPQVSIVAHTDVRRMLLRQKAIVEGGLLLVLLASRYQDLAQHAETEQERARAALLLDLLTPIAKTFPAEKGFESNVLALQIHGGYGYTSEYLPEAWLRDQKLNSIHEGTTGIQSNDLLGRKVLRNQGAAVAALAEEIEHTLEQAERGGIDSADVARLRTALTHVLEVTAALGVTATSDPERALRHAFDYMDMVSTLVVGWLWLLMATRASQALAEGRGDPEFLRGKLCAAQYWSRTELPRVVQLATLCQDGEDSFARMQDAWF
jgi:alkylation response protein AidB-like acyl-CoA dehydrogenase